VIARPVGAPRNPPLPQLDMNTVARVPRVLSERVRLAWTAREAAFAVPGVTGSDARTLGVHVTEAGSTGRLEGVICAATTAGGYAVSLRLICQPVPLHPLAHEIRTAVEASVAQALPESALEGVNIAFVDLAEGTW